MDDHGEGFDSVQWPREPEPQEPQSHTQSSFSPQRALPVRTNSRRRESMASEHQAGEDADAVDLAGIGVDGILECTVDTPLKENDGTKDAYVSYLVTTHVRSNPGCSTKCSPLTPYADRLQNLCQRRLLCPPPFHRLRLPPQHPASRLPCLRHPSCP